MRCVLGFVALLTFNIMLSQVAAAETSDECLARLTREKVKALEDMCWDQAENSAGTISDNSPATQRALKCEKEIPRSLSDAEASYCLSLETTNPTDKGDQTNTGMQADVPLPPRRGRVGLVPAKTPAKTSPSKTTAKNKPSKTTTSDADSPSQSASSAQAAADRDLNSCLGAKSQAQQCCNNPMSCASSLSPSMQQSLAAITQQSGPQAGQSLADYCAQMQSMSAASGDVNNGLASLCISNQNTCSSTCSSLISKYQRLVDSCDDCDAASVYDSTLSALTSASMTCNSLKANATAMARQGVGSAQGQAAGGICNQQASFNPQSAGLPGMQAAFNPADPYGCSVNPQNAACQAVCQANPGSQACAAITKAEALARGTAGFTPEGKRRDDASDFNVGIADGFGDYSRTNSRLNAEAAPINGNQAAVVPNNSGGGMPGGDNAPPANLSAGKAKSGAVAPNSRTDIMEGTRSGGYSQGSGFDIEPPPSFQRGRAVAAAGKDDGILGMDLKKYLPGGSLDSRRLAGRGGGRGEINGRGVDLFKKISNKMIEKCKLGILWECKP